MSIDLNKPLTGLRTSNSGGAIGFAPRDGYCGDIVLNAPYVGLRAAAVNGAAASVVGNQQVNDDGTLIINKPYIGLVASGVNGASAFAMSGRKCCFCSSVTSLGTGGPYGAPPSGPIMYCRITSSAFPSPIVHPIFYSPHTHQEVITSSRVAIYNSISMLEPEVIFSGPDTHPEGWWTLNDITYSSIFVFCSPGNWYYLIIEVRRCDMKVFVTQQRMINQITTPEVRIKAYTQCNDPGDIIQCSPFYVKRKMDFSTALVGGRGFLIGQYYNEPLTSCTGTGSGCSGAEYLELFFPGYFDVTADSYFEGTSDSYFAGAT